MAWSKHKIGVDVERSDRIINGSNIIKRIYSKEEKEFILKLEEKFIRSECLNFWLLKEASIKLKNGNFPIDLNN